MTIQMLKIRFAEYWNYNESNVGEVIKGKIENVIAIMAFFVIILIAMYL